MMMSFVPSVQHVVAKKMLFFLWGAEWRCACMVPSRWYLSHLLNAVGEDVSDDDPLLRRGPQVHLNQDNVVE